MGLGFALLILLLVLGYTAFDRQRRAIANVERKLDLILEKLGARDPHGNP